MVSRSSREAGRERVKEVSEMKKLWCTARGPSAVGIQHAPTEQSIPV
jgi:hypothetical protein